MNYEDTLIAMLAPEEILAAAKRIDAAGKDYHKDDMAAVMDWYNQATGQNKYGQ